MSPDARLIASALLFASTANDPEYTVERIASHVEAMEDALATQFPDSDRGIRGMVPVAYLKDVIEGFIARLEAARLEEHGGVNQDNVLEALNYAKNRLADCEAL